MKILSVERVDEHDWLITTVTQLFFLIPVRARWFGKTDKSRRGIVWYDLRRHKETNRIIAVYLTQQLLRHIRDKAEHDPRETSS